MECFDLVTQSSKAVIVYIFSSLFYPLQFLIRRSKFQSQTTGLPHATAPCPILAVASVKLGHVKYSVILFGMR